MLSPFGFAEGLFSCFSPLPSGKIALMFLPWDSAVKLLLSFVLGGIVGFEREAHEKPAGLRTHILVAMAATLFTLLSLSNAFGDPAEIARDPARVASGILTGMGFLGAGVIISVHGHVKGITTAASLWITAAVGMAVGIGEYGLAIFTTFLVLLTLTVLVWIEKRFGRY